MHVSAYTRLTSVASVTFELAMVQSQQKFTSLLNAQKTACNAQVTTIVWRRSMTFDKAIREQL